MTFSHLPFRTSSEDNALDTALNTWAAGEQPDAADAPAEYAIEFHRWADDVRRSEPAATGPAASTWNRVLRQSAQTVTKGKTMSTAALGNELQAASVYGSRLFGGEGVRRLLNLAATLAIVFAVTVGGWFAMSQLPAGEDGRFAGFQGTPDVAQSHTCDVEPMTVDEVMAIVENPYSYSYDPERASKNLLTGSMKVIEMDYYEAWMYRIDDELLSSGRTQVTVQDFDAASDRMNGWLSCAFDGTAGQALSFVDPFDIQRLVLSNFPVYRDVATVRESVGSLLEMPASNLWGTYQSAFSAEGLTVKANPVREDASQLDDEQALRYNSARILQIGVRVTDEEGETVFENSFSGVRTVDSSIPLKDGFTVLMAKSAFNGEWYVLAFLPDRT